MKLQGAIAILCALLAAACASPKGEIAANPAGTAQDSDTELPSLIGPPTYASRDNSVFAAQLAARGQTAPGAQSRLQTPAQAQSGGPAVAKPYSAESGPAVRPSDGAGAAAEGVTMAADVAASAAQSASAGLLIPSGWEPWILHPSKALTRYRLEKFEGAMTLRADADSSASGLKAMLRVDPMRRPMLEWRWRVDSLVAGADNSDRYAEDAPVRIVLAFDGDKSALPLKDRLFFEQAKLFAGNELPYATLMYIWENNKPVGTVIQNPHTARVRKIVVASGPVGVREWQNFRRNIVDDFKLAYGKLPGKLVGIAILTDTDNTKEKVTAWYGDIKLLRK